MIESFKHKGLRPLFEDDNPRGVNPEHVRKIRQILGLMNAAQKSPISTMRRTGCIH